MRISARGLRASLAAVAIFFAGTACDALLPASFSPRTTAPSPSVQLTPTRVENPPELPLFQRVVLKTVHSEEHGQPFDFSILTTTPQLTGIEDPRVAAFNSEMNTIIAEAVVEFKATLPTMPPMPSAGPSSFEIRYELLSPPGPVFSIKFEMSGYIAGAAHPYSVSRTSNFDLEQGRDLELDELFQPGSAYLEVISAFCVAQLEQRNIAFDASNGGAAPTLENYRNWNMRADGLMITFDEYQVAAYAAGPQLVLVPYATLLSIIRSPGPLGAYVH